ncbi:hypothetical protein EDD69_11359 [Thermolongibacillus altinsuensis]|uniref:Uncharacterized protein n=1 Tax=Thermolongibacillus altinsuensis TaxID=575256 RepID=A0A4R1QBG6_9BACL|nr:hypothetical protein [Thermolongibacillus altinsuensis]TCL47053.1 hypothetical protein EDD69_11359 [Thermolongibacillus altinsuensis]
MSLINQIINHPMYSTLDKAKESLENIENNEEFISSLDEYAIQALNRTRAVLSHLKVRINSIDPLLLRKALQDQINTELNNINNQLIGFETTFKNHNNLNNLNQRLDNILAYTSQIVNLINEDSIETIRETVTSFRKSVGQQKSFLERQQEEFLEKSSSIYNQIEDFKQKIEDYESRLNSELQKIQDKYNEFHQNFITSQESRSQQFLELKEEFIEEFRELTETLNKETQEIISSFKEEFDSAKEELLSTQESFFEETKQKLADYDSMLESHKKSVEELVGIISTSSISGHFKEVADYKRKLANRWQIGTILSFLLTIGFGFYTFIIEKDSIDWPGLVARIVVTAALGSLTAYAAKQAAYNEAEERKNRKMEVELKTLNPYLASFSPEDQIKLKQQLFPLIFGKEEVAVSQESTQTSVNSLNSNNAALDTNLLLQTVMEFIKNSKNQ